MANQSSNHPDNSQRVESTPTDESDTFQKIRRRPEEPFPVCSRRRSKSALRKTVASRRANKRNARLAGGVHQRRRRRYT